MVERERPVRSSTVFNRMMRSVLDIGRSHIDIGSPSTEHNENFSDERKGQFQLEFGQFYNDLHDLTVYGRLETLAEKPFRCLWFGEFSRAARFCG